MALRIKRTASATWRGEVGNGAGRIWVDSGLIDVPYTLKTREHGGGTNPEEMLGAAHAGCFAMSLANALHESGHTPARVDASADVYLENDGRRYSIGQIVLTVTSVVPGIDPELYQELVEQSRASCPISRALAGTTIVAHASLADQQSEGAR